MEQEYENNQYVEKRQFYFSMTIMILITITLFLAVFLVMSDKIDESIKAIDVIESTTDTEVFNEQPIAQSNITTVYRLKDYNGKLAIYENEKLIEILDIYTFTLPEKDKKLLSSGIDASTRKELDHIIESYY